jgi:ectoine hydroxylase-related dioxygenase (phytanoyl-CoA dioxygenase family)
MRINKIQSEQNSIFNKKKRSYAFKKRSLLDKKTLNKCSNIFNKYGFCVIDEVIPSKEISAIRDEIIEAQKKISKNIKKIKELLNSKKFKEDQLLRNKKIKIRSLGREGRLAKPVNDIIWMPSFAKYLGNSSLIKLGKNLLDNHIRIAQIHPKIIPSNISEDSSEILMGNDSFGLPRLYKGPATARDWHTDWPHDPSASGGGNSDENIGFIRQPFPDVTMCLVIIFYLNDVDEKSGGTWAVPGSHKDKRNPRGPKDKITLTAPIKGEIQIKAKAGSVFIQDSRLWHSSPLHNLSHNDRVAVVSRWCPWWLSIDEFAPKSRFNIVCRPLGQSEFLKLPKNLQPLMRHLCHKELNTIQKSLLNQSKAAAKRTRWAHKKLKNKNFDLRTANDNIEVSIPNLKK